VVSVGACEHGDAAPFIATRLEDPHLTFEADRQPPAAARVVDAGPEGAEPALPSPYGSSAAARTRIARGLAPMELDPRGIVALEQLLDERRSIPRGRQQMDA